MSISSTAQAAKTLKRMIIAGMAATLLSLPSYAQKDTLTITFTGDVLLDRGVRQRIEHTGTEALFSPSIDSLFQVSDLVVGNLECPATRIHQPNFKKFIFRAEPEWLDCLQQHGFTHLNLANNHTIDQGRKGLMDTRDNIIAAGMTPFGADTTMKAASQPLLLANLPRPVYILASLRLALENFPYLPLNPCPSQEPMDTLLLRVSKLRLQHPEAVIIVSLHWGGEHTLRPAPQQRIEAHAIIDAGADILICHHTHTLQTIENYQGHYIYYSIGNFIFDQTRDINSKAAVVQLTVTPDTLNVRTHHIYIHKCAPYLTSTLHDSANSHVEAEQP